MDHEAITALVENGLERHHPRLCNAWKTRDADQRKAADVATEAKLREMMKSLEQALPKLESPLRNAIIDKVVDAFP